MESMLDKANMVLAALRIHSEMPWDGAPIQLFDVITAQRYQDMAKAISHKNDQLHPWGTVRGSWRDMQQYVPSLLPSELPNAVSLLKQHNKIFQCGRGGGKCFIVTDPSPIPTSTTVIDKQDPVSLAKELKTTVDQLVADNAELRKRNEQLIKAVQEKDVIISEFRRNEAVSQRLTWS